MQLFNDDSKISVYARHSEKTKILGQDNISLCDAEERALINKYKNSHKLLNKL